MGSNGRGYWLLWAAICFTLSIMLTATVSKFEGYDILSLYFSRQKQQQYPEIAVSLATADYDHNISANVIVSSPDDNGISDLWFPARFSLEFPISLETRQRLIVENVSSCGIRTASGRQLKVTTRDEMDLSATMLVERMGTSNTWMMDINPYSDNEYWHKLIVRCEVSLPNKLVNRTLVRRKITIRNIQTREMIERVSEQGHLSIADYEYYIGKYEALYNEYTGRIYFRSIQLSPSINTAENLVLYRGNMPINPDDEIHPNHSESYFLTWDDIRFQQLRDILLVIIGALIGLGTTLLVEGLKPSKKSKSGYA